MSAEESAGAAAGAAGAAEAMGAMGAIEAMEAMEVMGATEGMPVLTLASRIVGAVSVTGNVATG